MPAHWIITLALGLRLVAPGRDWLDQWIEATVLPPLAFEMSSRCWTATARFCGPIPWPMAACPGAGPCRSAVCAYVAGARGQAL